MLLLFLFFGAIAAMTALFVVQSQLDHTVDLSISGDVTLDGLTDSSSDTLDGIPCPTPMPQGDWKLALVTRLCDASDLMDSLEMQGFKHRELVVLGNASFAVRWR